MGARKFAWVRLKGRRPTRLADVEKIRLPLVHARFLIRNKWAEPVKD